MHNAHLGQLLLTAVQRLKHITCYRVFFPSPDRASIVKCLPQPVVVSVRSCEWRDVRHTGFGDGLCPGGAAL